MTRSGTPAPRKGPGPSAAPQGLAWLHRLAKLPVATCKTFPQTEEVCARPRFHDRGQRRRSPFYPAGASPTTHECYRMITNSECNRASKRRTFGRRCALALAGGHPAEVVHVVRDSLAVTTRNGLLPPEEAILGASSAMNEVRDKLAKIAYADVPVLIRGEAGSGKEVLARLIHKKYPGEATPFHKVSPAGRAGWRKSASFMTPCEGFKSADGNGHDAGGTTANPGCIGTLFLMRWLN